MVLAFWKKLFMKPVTKEEIRMEMVQEVEKKIDAAGATPPPGIDPKQYHSVRLNFCLRAMEVYLAAHLSRNSTVEFTHWLRHTTPEVVLLADAMTDALLKIDHIKK